MAKIPPPAPRAQIAENGDELRVVVPVRRDWFTLLFLPLWLAGWAFGEIMVWRALLTGEASGPAVLFLLVWLMGWTAGGAWALFNWCWNAKGHEFIVVGDETFSVRYEAFGAGKTWEFDPRAVRNLRVIDGGSLPSAWSAGFGTRKGGWNQTGIWSGPLAFDYGAKTFRFGAGMDEAEARDVLPYLLRRLSPDDPPAASSFSHSDDR